MSSPQTPEPIRRYLGIDVGGTKIQASLVEESGVVRGRDRAATPREGGPDRVIAELETLIETVLDRHKMNSSDLTAIGIAIPGVVDPEAGLIVVTPNMSLSGISLSAQLESRFGVPVAMGNDCNLGALGEVWLGSARNTASSISILVGTGIGSGVVRDGRLWRGARESAGEIGHIVMQVGGPKCGCGNLGCFEALAGRVAIERDLRAAMAAGRSSILPELLDDASGVMRSGVLRRALEAEDELVTEVMRRAAETIGYACLTVRHLIDPEVIVLGGGVVEACGNFVVPIIKEIIAEDQLPGAREGGHVRLSALGDDAVVLGAVALARTQAGRDPFDAQFAVAPSYPQITGTRFGEVTIDGTTHARDVVIRVDGNVKKRKKEDAKAIYGTSHMIGPKELRRACRGGPEAFFIGAGHNGQVELTEEGKRFLDQRLISHQILPTAEAVAAYNASDRRKAALIHVTC